MSVRPIALLAALVALLILPSTALAAPKKAFIGLSASTYSVAENSGTFQLTLQRTGNSRTQVAVPVSVTGGTATNGNQYSFTSPQTVTFMAGETTKKLAVTINDNSTLNPPNKTVIFHLGTPVPVTGSAGIKTANATLTILLLIVSAVTIAAAI